jgi:hypothetical protein
MAKIKKRLSQQTDASSVEGTVPRKAKLANKPHAMAPAQIAKRLVDALMVPTKSPNILLAESLEAIAKTLRRQDAVESGKRRGRPANQLDLELLLKIIDRWSADAGHKITDAKAAEKLVRAQIKAVGSGASKAKIRGMTKTLRNRISIARKRRILSQ